MHYSFHSTPTCTFKSRTQTVTKANQLSSVPGPSDYHNNKPLPKAPTIAHTQQKRNLYKKFEPNPGPGTYEAPVYTTAGTKRSMSAKYIDYNKHTPGPQDYESGGTKLLNKSPVYSMGNKSKSTKEIITDHNKYKPGAGNYESKGSFHKTHGVFIGKDARHDLTETEKTPAPNYYKSETAKDYATINNPRCRVGSEFRKTTDFMKSEVTPGPAFYKHKSFVQNNSQKKTGYSCRQKLSDLIAVELSKFPAPGMYESHLNNKSQAPRCATTQTKRKTFMDDMQDFKKKYPGPGVHDPKFAGTKYRAASAKTFSKSARKPLDENEKTPGPVGYASDKLLVMNKAPKYSSTKTVAKNQFLGVNPEQPGPGQYNPNDSLVKPKSTINQVGKEKRPDFEKQKYTPGPGYYNLRGKEEGPTWKFSTQKRVAFTDLKSEAKDGTHYQLTSRVVDPPGYMNVTSKIQYSPHKQMGATGFSVA